jgi:hypothetical protein
MRSKTWGRVGLRKEAEGGRKDRGCGTDNVEQMQ